MYSLTLLTQRTKQYQRIMYICTDIHNGDKTKKQIWTVPTNYADICSTHHKWEKTKTQTVKTKFEQFFFAVSHSKIFNESKMAILSMSALFKCPVAKNIYDQSFRCNILKLVAVSVFCYGYFWSTIFGRPRQDLKHSVTTFFATYHETSGHINI